MKIKLIALSLIGISSMQGMELLVKPLETWLMTKSNTSQMSGRPILFHEGPGDIVDITAQQSCGELCQEVFDRPIRDVLENVYSRFLKGPKKIKEN